jgi:hypothetical protein
MVFSGLGNVQVLADATAGYIVDCSQGVFQNNTCVVGSTPMDGVSGCVSVTSDNSKLLCSNVKDPSNAGQVYYAGCPNGSTGCTIGSFVYSGCQAYGGANGTTLCTNKSNGSNTNVATLSDNGFTCDVTGTNVIDNKTDTNSVSCVQTGQTTKLTSPPCVGYTKTDKTLGLSCSPEVIVFKSDSSGTGGDTSNYVTDWPVSGGRVFKSSDGGNVFIQDNGFGGNAVTDVCTSLVQRIPGIISFVYSVGSAITNNITNSYGCTQFNTLGDFKTALAGDGVTNAKNIVNPTEVTATQTQLTNCVDTQYQSLAPDQQKKAQTLNGTAAPAATDTFKVCNSGTIVGKASGDKVIAIGADGTTKTYDLASGGAVAATTNTQGTNPIQKLGTNIAGALFDIVSAILLWFVYLMGWIAVMVLYFLGLIILYFLRTNPAGGSYFQVAVAPWTLLIGVTNLLVLGSFIYVGFGYILNIKNLKKNVSDFLQSVVIIAIALNFTILGTATIINITQGIGDVFIYSYAATKKGTKPEDINSVLIGSVESAIGRVSVLRCGNQITTVSTDATSTAATATPAATPATAANPSTECSLTADPAGQISKLASTTISPVTNLLSGNGKMGQATSALISEGLFLGMMCVAIYVFWKSAYMAVMRIIGLWLLMITSPIALAAYLSPIDSLKPIGQQWINKLIKWAPFYPIFVFALVMVNLLTDKFSQIVAAGDVSLVNDGTSSGGQLFNLSLQTILGAVISIGALYSVTNFLDKDFENFAKQAASSVGQYAKTGTSLYGAFTRGVVGGAVNGTLGEGVRRFYQNKSKGLDSQIEDTQTKLNEAKLAKNTVKVAELEAKKKRLDEQKKLADKRSNQRFTLGVDTIANAVEFTPYAVEGLLKTPGHIGAQYSKQAKANADRFKAGSLARLGYFMSSNPAAYKAAELAGYNLYADKDLGINEGENPNSIKDAIAVDAKNGLPNRFESRVEDAGDEAYRKTLGLSEKLGEDIGEIVIQGIVNKIAQKKDLSAEDRRMIEQTIESEDSNLTNLLLSQGGANEVRKIFSRFSGETQRKIAKKMPYLLPTEDAQVSAVMSATEEDLENMNTDRLTDAQRLALNGRPLSDRTRARLEETKTYATQDLNLANNQLKNNKNFKFDEKNPPAVKDALEAAVKTGKEQIRQDGSHNELYQVSRFKELLDKGEPITEKELADIHKEHNKKEYGFVNIKDAVDENGNKIEGLENLTYSEDNLTKLKQAGFADAVDLNIDESTEEGKKQAFQVYKRLAGVAMAANEERRVVNQQAYVTRAKKIKAAQELGDKYSRAHAATADALNKARGELPDGASKEQIEDRARGALQDKKVQSFMGAADLQEKMDAIVQGGGKLSSRGLKDTGLNDEVFANLNSENRAKYGAELIDKFTGYLNTGNSTDLENVIREMHTNAGFDMSHEGKNEAQIEAINQQAKEIVAKMTAYAQSQGKKRSDKYLLTNDVGRAFDNTQEAFDTRAQDVQKRVVEKKVRKFNGLEYLTNKSKVETIPGEAVKPPTTTPIITPPPTTPDPGTTPTP